MTDIEKNTYQDKREILSKAVRAAYKESDSWAIDFDDTYVYFETWVSGVGYTTYKSKYSYNGTAATLSGDATKVVKTTQYKDVVEKSLEQTLVSVLEKFLGSKEKDELKIIKAVDAKKMVIYEPLANAPGDVDGVGDTYLLEDVEYLVNSVNKHKPTGNYFHAIDTEDFVIEKAWLNPFEAKLDVDGEIKVIPENLPIAKVVFKNQKAFEYRLNNKLLGLSIGARVEKFEDVEKGLIEKDGRVAVRRLVHPHFDFKGSHIAYTEESQGGACSLMNDPILAEKSLRRPLTEEQKETLVGLGHNLSELSKSLEGSEKNSGLSSPDGASQGEQPENKTNEGNEMSQEILKQLEDLKRELAVEKAVNAVSKYGFEEVVATGLAGAIASLSADEKTAVLKALDVLVAAKDEAVNKAKEEAVEKAKETKPENEIAKQLQEEAGHAEKQEAPVEKSKMDKLKELQEQTLQARKKGAKV